MNEPNHKDPTDVTRVSYDKIARTCLDKHRDRTEYREHLDAFSSLLNPGALVLDVGSGPGIEAAELKARGFEVICIDLSFGMLDVGS